MTKPPLDDDLTRIPGLFRRWELAQLFEPNRSYRIENAGLHADGTPLLAIYSDLAERVPLAVVPLWRCTSDLAASRAGSPGRRDE